MKKYVLLILISSLGFSCFAQNFEGIIKWSLTTNIDPAKKAQMQNGVNGAGSSDKIDAGIKMMEQRLSDPKISENPTAKAQIEQQLLMMKSMRDAQASGGGGFDAMMPKGFTIEMKNGNTLTTMQGGMANVIGDILHLKAQDKSYAIKKDQKSYFVMPQNAETGPDISEAKVTKTDEMQKILIYNCRKYLVTSKDKKGRQVFQTIWATTDIKDIDLKSFSKMKTGDRGMSFFYKEIEGIPLKIENKMEEGGITMEVVDIKRQPLSDADFQIPSDFKETKAFGR